MNSLEQLTSLIQRAVGGCAKNWAETIAIYLLNRGTYLYGKQEVHLDIFYPDKRLTDRRVINGWDMEEEGIDFTDIDKMRRIYHKLGIYEDMQEDGFIREFLDKEIDT